jgi:hypothetical protein
MVSKDKAIAKSSISLIPMHGVDPAFVVLPLLEGEGEKRGREE